MKATHQSRSRRSNRQKAGGPLIQQAISDTDLTWDGGGREPMHPDDLEEDSVIERDKLRQQTRSDDN